MQTNTAYANPGAVEVAHALTRARAVRVPRWAIGVAVSLGTLVALDATLGVFCQDGQFRQWRLPPYPLLFTENQTKWLQEDDWPYYRFDAELGWTLRPNARFSEGRYRTNSIAVRSDREYARVAPEGVARVAVFGDSFIHGDEVRNHETAWAMLEWGHLGLEIMNFGVPGYGTDQSYLRYMRDAAAFHPDVVVVGFMLENIQRNVSVFRPAYYHDTGLPLVKPRFRLSDGNLEAIPCPAESLNALRQSIAKGTLVNTLCETDFWVRRSPLAYRGSPIFASSLVRITYAAYANRGRSASDYYLDPDSEPFQVTAAVLGAFCRRATDDGAKNALVLVLPDKSTVREYAVTPDVPYYWTHLTDRVEARGCRVLDFTPALMESVRRDGVDPYFAGTHLSPLGHATLARFMESADAVFRE